MKIPSKIYIRKVHLESLAENDSPLGANLPVGKKPFPMEEDNCVEYINLSDIWNDNNKSTPIANGDAFKYPIIVYAKLQGSSEGWYSHYTRGTCQYCKVGNHEV